MDDNRKVLITCHVTIENNIPPDPKDAKKDDWKERVVVILRAVRASTMGSKARQAAEEAGGERVKAPRVHAEALQLATELGDLLGGHCERIEVVGSLRRRLPVVGDIELLAEPIPSRSFDLFGDPETGGSCPLCLALDAAQKYQSFFPYQPPAGNNEEAGVWDALRAALPRDRAIACLMCMEDV